MKLPELAVMPKPDRLRRLSNYLGIPYWKLVKASSRFAGIVNLRHVGLEEVKGLLTQEELKEIKEFFAVAAEMLFPERLPDSAFIEDIINYVASLIVTREEENLVAVPMSGSAPIGIHVVGEGSGKQVMTSLTEVFKAAVRMNATGLLVIHNHPGGDPTPSDKDYLFANQLMKAGALLGIQIVDFIIVSPVAWYSMAMDPDGVEGLIMEYKTLPETAPLVYTDLLEPQVDGKVVQYLQEMEAAQEN